jgi:pimeloyl-ACP methyl ester carboxylesterase
MTDQLKSEKLAYEFMLEQFKANGNQNMVRKLGASPVTMTGAPDAYLALRDGAMHSLGVGTMRDMKSVISGIFLPSLTFREYSLSDKINLWRGKIRTGVSVMWSAIMKTDLTREVPALEIPVYFLEGRYDYTCSYALAKDYFSKLKAPVKGFYTFERSAHSPIFEEPAKARNICCKTWRPGQPDWRTSTRVRRFEITLTPPWQSNSHFPPPPPCSRTRPAPAKTAADNADRPP